MKFLHLVLVLFGLLLLPVSASAVTLPTSPSIASAADALAVIKTGTKKAKTAKNKSVKKIATKKRATKKVAKQSKRRVKKVASYKTCGKLMYRDKKTKKCVSATDKKA